jgi:hypothetical protein
MKEDTKVSNIGKNRRLFLRNSMITAGAASMGAGLLPGSLSAFAKERDREEDDDRAPITKGDIAILRFLQALEQVEADLWIQYSELGGTQDNEVPGAGSGNAAYIAAIYSRQYRR